MAGIKIDITGDNTNFLRAVREAEEGVRNASRQIEANGGSIEKTFERIKQAAEYAFVGFSAKEFISSVAQVRGEFQQLEVAFNTMLGSKEKADALMQQLVNTAAITPFDLQGVSNGAKQLLAYGDSVENVNDDLIRLGNIAAGLSQPLGDIVYLYGTTMTQGRLYTQDLNQFTGRGIPMIRELANVFGVAEGEVKKLVEEGKVGFSEVQKVIQNLTNEGGMFYNLMQEQSKTITGQISNIEDAFSTMLNNIGKANEGVINDALSGVSYLVENYEQVGKILTSIVATYGAYKAAVITVTAIQSAHAAGIAALTVAERIHYGWLVITATAQKALNAAMLTNPYVAIAAAVVALGTAMWALADRTTESEKALNRFNKKQEEAQKLEQEHKQKIDSLVNSSRDIALSDLQRGQSLAELRKEYPKIFAQYDIESIKLADILQLKQQIAAEDAKRAGENKEKELSSVESDIKYYENLLKSLSGQQGVDGYVKKLNELRADRDVLLQEKGKSISEQFISGLDDIDISDFDRYITELEKRIKGKGENGKVKLRLPIDVKGSLSDEAIYDVKDIQTLIDTAKSKKQARIYEEKNGATYQEDLAKAKDDWEKAKKGYESLVKDQKATTEQVKAAREQMESAEKAYKDLGGDTKANTSKVDNKQLDQQKRIYEQLLSLRRQNQQDEINLMEDGTEKKLKQIDLDYQKELDAIKKQRADLEKEQGGQLTDEQTDELGKRARNAAQTREKGISDTTKAQIEAERQAMNEYLKEYGDYMQKRQAIAELYNEKIAKAGTEGEKLALQKQLEESLHSIDLSNLKDSVNWEQVFGNLDKVSTDALASLKEKLRDFVAAQKDLSPENMKELVEAIDKIDEKISERNPFATMKESFSELKQSTDALREAQEAYNDALENGTDEEKKNAKAMLDSAKNAKQKALSEATTSLHNSVDEIRQYTGAADSIIGIMETIGIEIPEFLKGFTDGFGQTLDGLSNIDLTKPMSVITGGLQAVKGALTSVVSLGGLIPGFGGADYSKYNKMKEEYDTLIDVWDTLIDKKQEYIDIDYGIEAAKEADEATQLVNTNIARTRQLAMQLKRSGKSIGSHSLGYRVDKRMGNEGWAEVSKLVGQNVKNITDLFNLDASVIGNALQSEKLVTTLTTVNEDFLTYIQDMDKYSEQLEEIAEKEKEAFTGISFDSFRDSFVDTLADLDSTNKDFADSFEKYLQNAVFSSLVANQYKDRIQALYDKWAAYGESDAKITKEEAEALRTEQERITEDMLKKREELMQTFGWTSTGTDAYSQQASSKGFQTMSQDTGEELNGRFTAIQASNEEIKNQVIAAVSGIYSLVSTSTESNAILDNILTQHVLTNSYLEDIAKYSKVMTGFGAKLDKIVEQTK